MNTAATSVRKPTSSRVLQLLTLAGYLLACLAIGLAWSVRDQNLIRAEDGLGYWLGVVGASLMLALLVYPLRKRMRILARLGSIRFWFRTHMIFGVVGPVLVLFHSNFVMGSLNGRVALFCTLIVASSGIVGRYLYAKIHYGVYGQRATLASLQADAAAQASAGTRGLSPVALINEHLQPYERHVLERARRVIPSVLTAVFTPLRLIALRRRLRHAIRQWLDAQASASPTFAGQRDRLLRAADDYLDRRLTTYRKFAQISGCERLFGLWHIVHFPLFVVMVLAAIVHVIAVHAY